jgi:hypothetical protein
MYWGHVSLAGGWTMVLISSVADDWFVVKKNTADSWMISQTLQWFHFHRINVKTMNCSCFSWFIVIAGVLCNLCIWSKINGGHVTHDQTDKRAHVRNHKDQLMDVKSMMYMCWLTAPHPQARAITCPVRLAYQPPANSTFLSEQTSHATSQQYFSLRTNQHPPSATSQTNRLTDRGN